MASRSLLARQQLSAGTSSRHSGLSGQQQQHSVGGARQEASSRPSSTGALPSNRSTSAPPHVLGSAKPAASIAATAGTSGGLNGVGVGVGGGNAIAAGAGGSSKAAATAAPARTSPKEYMDQLKRELPAEMYRTVQSLLSQYRSGKNAQQLIEGLLALLKGPATVHLLQGFTHFLPKSDQPWVREVIKTHMDAAAAAKQNGQQGHSAQRMTAGLGSQPLQPQQQNRAHQSLQQHRKQPEQQQKHAQHAQQQNSVKQQPQPPQQNRAHQPPQQQQQKQAQQAQQQQSTKGQPQPQRPMQQQKLSFGGPARNSQLQGNQQQQQQQQQQYHQNAQKPRSGPQQPQKQHQQQQLLPQKRARETTSPLAAVAADRPGAQGPPFCNTLPAHSGSAWGSQGQHESGVEASGRGASCMGPPPNVPSSQGGLGGCSIGASPSTNKGGSGVGGAPSINRGGGGANGDGRGAGLDQGGGAGGGAMPPRALIEPAPKRPRIAGAVMLSASAACSICAACPMEAPHEAACGHLGCGKCWTLQLAQHFCCAACKRPLRRQQLIRKHYAGGS
ncbi:hypothetical protein DUNSADRAFT_15935 [Dunaliella salina]|uniref:Uncharacterized protein n=1 Tax=Dunaliella salina TaxID=3046 RepID=A0ABQ7G4M4_DUNSA|nr:hypothetical protein DUNSADRAFT_15935 [Dunaliella salina]|eukprot:KAF5829553.1 hypothetical protein DUNSADRAFT_15935 [Dunaliella salina]